MLKKEPKTDIIKERDGVREIRGFLDSDLSREGRILVLYGLRRTGKTVMMEQALRGYKGKAAYYECSPADTMEDILNILDKEQDAGTEAVCLDEITNVVDFLDEAAYLPDIYAKEGMKIILAGTDSLGFEIADRGPLFGRAEWIHTTYIPFSEHSRVLGIRDMDDYIEYGGLMARGISNGGFITNSKAAARYLDSAVADNIARSLKNSETESEISAFSREELRSMINRLVEVYSGAFDLRVLGNFLKDVTVNYPVSKLAGRIDNEELRSIRSDRKNITEEFAHIIQADTGIQTPVTPKAVKELRRMLMDMDVLSSTKKTVYSHDRESGWEVSETGNDAYLIQPAVKYWHLEAAKEYIEESRYFAGLAPEDRKALKEKLEEKIKGDMTEQIIAFEAGRDLSTDRYEVLKPVFRENGQGRGEYDLLIYDNEENSHYAFEIKHTDSPFIEQSKHLTNADFSSYMSHLFGARKCAAVLYRGESFRTEHDGMGILYLNISDFLINLSQTHDIEITVTELAENLKEQRFNADGAIGDAKAGDSVCRKYDPASLCSKSITERKEKSREKTCDKRNEKEDHKAGKRKDGEAI